MPVELRPRRPTITATSTSGSVTSSVTTIAHKQHQAMDTATRSVSFSPALKVVDVDQSSGHAKAGSSGTPSLATDSSGSASSGDSGLSSQPLLPATPISRTGSPSSAELLGLYGPRPVRAQFACDYCRQRKAKCSGTEPCDRCIAKKQNCSFSTVQNQRKVTRSLRDLHAERLGIHCIPDPHLRSGVKAYLDRQGHRVGPEHHVSGSRRTVMSQGGGASHLNHVHWALSAQQQQRMSMMGSASASAHPYWNSRPASMRYSGPYSAVDNSSSTWMNGLVNGQEALYGYSGTATSWYPTSNYGHEGSNGHMNIGTQPESEVGYSMSAPGSVISTSTTPGGSSTPHMATHPLGASNASLMTDASSSIAREGDAVTGSGVYSVHNAYAQSMNGDWPQNANSSGEGGTVFNTSSRPGWRYDPLPPPPASIVLGQEHHQHQVQDMRQPSGLEDHTDSNNFAARAYYASVPSGNLTLNATSTGPSPGTSSPAGHDHKVLHAPSSSSNEGHHNQGDLLISASDLGFRPPSPC